MTDKEALQRALVETLVDIDFDRKYYGFYREVALDEGADAGLDRAEYAAAIDAELSNVTYHKGEDFWRHRRSSAWGDAELRVAFPHSTAEFILSVRTAEGVIGGPYSRLARLAGLQRDPDFSPEPRAPKLPFRDEATLGRVVAFGAELFASVCAALEDTPSGSADGGGARAGRATDPDAD